ncbi:uncharacterized protein At3g49720 [Selaginella moellendorffii]|nr:uncharacterized protein At3g49720 [Selaginella moellendorffii]|eukprot:XP_002960138.2 uncharacterized protein At3g49720 [Selaginella moellendorffii]
MNNAMSRRPRRSSDDSGGNGLSSSAQAQSKSDSSSLVSACVLFVVMVLFFVYLFGPSTFQHHSKTSPSSAVATARKLNPSLLLRSLPVETHTHDTEEEDQHEQLKSIADNNSEEASAGVLDALPLLQEVYGKHMKAVLHIGPQTCNVVARLLQDEGGQAWGVEPSEMTNPSSVCKSLVKKGLVRIADVHRGLPYRSKSFSLVLASNTLEHLTSRQLNRTLPELARLTSHAIVAFISSQPSQVSSARQLQAALKSIKSHNRTWWSRKFETAGLDEDEEMSKGFASLQLQRSYRSSDYIFHLLPRQFD